MIFLMSHIGACALRSTGFVLGMLFSSIVTVFASLATLKGPELRRINVLYVFEARRKLLRSSVTDSGERSLKTKLFDLNSVVLQTRRSQLYL